MTDRELLEAAARAAGIELRFSANGAPLSRDVINPEAWHGWNPLTDDGDALRLAVKLGFQLDIETPCGVVGVGPGAADESFQFDDFDAACAATRRAIVRAAAAMAPKEQT